MALSLKREDLKHVPWFSLGEWYGVYNQIYSNNHEEQKKGYETLLVWKARNPKLPVGVDCTLSLIQVSLRDREWSEKLEKVELPTYYENDLCMMYSLCLMRFLNHIAHIGHTKQTSLFQIAKQLNIPEWIVNLRHDAAHGHELPSIGVLRIAVNILLTWLHDEYWTAEIKNMMDYFNKKEEIVESSESEELQALEDLIELWTATGLYIHANYSLVSDLPDQQLRESLLELRTFTLQESQRSNASFVNEETESIAENLKSNQEYRLSTAQKILLSEISKCLSKSFLLNNSAAICSLLCDNEVFMPNSDFLRIFGEDETNSDLPIDFIKFWEGFINLLQEKKLIELLFLRLLKLVNEEKEVKHRRQVASRWLRSIVNALMIHKISQKMRLEQDQNADYKHKKLSLKTFSTKIRSKMENLHPDLKFPWLNFTIDVPFSRIDKNLMERLFLHPNEFTAEFLPSLLDLVMPKSELEVQKHLLSLLHIQTMVIEKDANLEENLIHSLENLTSFIEKENGKVDRKCETRNENLMHLSDQTIRNQKWQLESETENWSVCPFGMLPWQMNREESVKPLVIKDFKISTQGSSSTILPGVIDRKNLKMKSEINWSSVLREKGVSNKRRKRHSDILIDRAIKVIKKQL